MERLRIPSWHKIGVRVSRRKVAIRRILDRYRWRPATTQIVQSCMVTQPYEIIKLSGGSDSPWQ